MFDLEKLLVVYMVLVFFGVICFGVLVEENRRLRAENREMRRKVGHYEIYGHCQSGEKR